MAPDRQKIDEQIWLRMQFKQNKVWVAVSNDGKPIVKDGKALVKYQLKQDYEYWVSQNNLRSLPEEKNGKQTTRKAAKPKSTAPGEKSNPVFRVAIADEKSISPQDTANAICIYTDGASSGNPGPAGIGVLLQYGAHEKQISRFIGNATNNIAELMAIKTGLAEVKNPQLPVRLFTDSAYAAGVLGKGWKPKKNQELILSIIDILKQFKDIKIIKVKGHAGHRENEIADRLATGAISENR